MSQEIIAALEERVHELEKALFLSQEEIAHLTENALSREDHIRRRETSILALYTEIEALSEAHAAERDALQARLEMLRLTLEQKDLALSEGAFYAESLEAARLEKEDEMEALRRQLAGVTKVAAKRHAPPVLLPPNRNPTHDGSIPAEATLVCTVAAKNYLAAVRVFMASLQAYNPAVVPILLLVDEPDGAFDPAVEPYHILQAKDIGIPNWDHFTFKYDVLELSTAVKPYLMEYLFDTYDAANVIYFDPDIQVFGSLDRLRRVLESYMCVLTPHITAPLTDDRHPNELTFLRVGTYNLGFCALSKRGAWRDLLRWWQERLYTQCTREVDKGLFTDQHWMDFAPSLFPGVYVLRDVGYNVAYWNIATRPLQWGTAGYLVGEYPLIFMHFSGFEPDEPDSLSKHQDRFRLSELAPPYQECFWEYVAHLTAHDYYTTRTYSYGFERFPDGVPIPAQLRACLRTTDPYGRRWQNPYDLTGRRTFREWATHPTQGFRFVSPLMLRLYEERVDLQRAFPAIPGSDEEAYARWWVNESETISLFHPVYKRPILEALAMFAHYTPSADFIAATPIRSFRQRLTDAAAYYRRYPVEVRPYIDTRNSMPSAYSGPRGGVYGTVSRALRRLGLIRLARRVIGLRLILTTRYFFAERVIDVPHKPVLSSPRPPAPPPPPAVETPRKVKNLGMGVNIVGYAYSETGVGQQARNMIRAFAHESYPLSVEVIDDPDSDRARKQDRMAATFPQGMAHGISVFHANADMTYAVRNILPTATYEGRYNIGYWSWELSTFPTHWDEAFAIYDEIWTPSSFIQSAVAARSPLPIFRTPPSIEPAVPQGITRDHLRLPEGAFIVLFIFDAFSIFERKNPLALVDAFESAFTADERRSDVRLVIKANNLHTIPEQRAALKARLKDVNGILLEGYLSREETNALLKSCNVYASLHRSEGYGLTCAEAMYWGRPVVATGYSGNLDFMTPGNSHLVPYRLVPLERDYPPYDAGGVWAEPDSAAAGRLLRDVFCHPEDAELRGAQAAADIRAWNSPATVGKLMVERLQLIRRRFATE